MKLSKPKVNEHFQYVVNEAHALIDTQPIFPGEISCQKSGICSRIEGLC